MTFLGLIAYCFLLYIRPGDWVQAVLGWPLEMGVVTLTLATGLARHLTRGQDEVKRSWPIQLPLLALWVVAILLSDLVNGHGEEALSFSIAFAKRGLVFLMFWLALDTTWKMRATAVCLVVLTAVLGMQGIYQAEHGVGWAGQPLYWAGRICWIGLWDGANVLSLLFVTAVPFAIEMILGPWKWPARLVAIASMVFIIQGMILAESRGALLALGVVCVLYAVRRIGALGIGVGAIALVGVMAVAPSRMTHLEMDDTSDGQSSKQRVDMWAEGFEMLKGNPVLGIGKGEYAQYTGFLIAHNSFIQNMGETGVVGLFVWLSLIVVSFKGLGAVLRAAPRLSPQLVSISRAVNVAFVGYLATSLFITTDFEPLYILMALSAIAYDLARRELGGDLRIEFGLNEIAMVGAYEAGGIVVMYLVTRTLSAMM